jgi:hypothetical protein
MPADGIVAAAEEGPRHVRRRLSKQGYLIRPTLRRGPDARVSSSTLANTIGMVYVCCPLGVSRQSRHKLLVSPPRFPLARE